MNNCQRVSIGLPVYNGENYIKEAGEYFNWAAHDDLCAPKLLERCTAVIDQYPSVILCYPKTIMIEKDGKYQKYEDRFHLSFSKAYERFGYYQKMMPYVKQQ